MAVIADTSATITLERSGLTLEEAVSFYGTGELAIAAISMSELLEGVYRAVPGRRRDVRLQFVAAVLDWGPVIDFDIAVARTHARLRADLARLGKPIGAHDAIVAATALTFDAPVITENVSEFEQVPSLLVLSSHWT